VKITRRITQLLLLVYLALLVVTSLWPTPVDGGGVVWFVTSEILKFCHGISWLKWLQYNQLEALANGLLYLPLGIFLVVLLPKLKIYLALLIPIVVSVTAEGIQRYFLPSRYSTWDDVYHNALGGVIGVFIAASIRQLKKWKSQGR